MISLQLFIEDVQVELYKDESVTLTQTIQDVRDIQKIFADYSRTFNVPASRSNNKLFKHFYNPDVDGYDPRIKKDAELYLNYKIFKKGKIKLEGTSLTNNKGKTYRLTFFGNTINLKDLLGSDKLSSLPLLSKGAFQFNYNATNVSAYLQDGLDAYVGETIDDAVIVPLITHTDRLYYDSGSNVAGTFNLAVGSANKGVLFDQLKPALRVYAIIKAIEEFYSKDNHPNRVTQSIKFSTDFFNKTNTRLYNLYMWLHRKKGGVKEDDEPNVSQFTNLTTGGPAQTGLGITTDSLSLGVVPQSTDYKLEIKIQTTNTDYNVMIYKNGELFHLTEGQSGNQTILNFDDINDIGSGTFQFYVSSTIPSSMTLRGILKRIRFNGQTDSVAFSGTTTVTSDFPFIVGQQLPDITVIDFLTGLFKMFNLTAYYDEDTEEIKVLPLDDFYASSTTTYDVTKFLDKESSQIDSLLPYKRVEFGYEGLDTFFASDHLQRFGKEWGTEKYDAGVKYDGDDYVIKLPFEHLKYERLLSGSTPTSIQWGWSVNKDLESHIGKPLLFYPVSSTGTDISFLNTLSSKQTISTYYIPSNSVSITSSNNINFSAEINEYARTVFHNTLFKNHYNTYITETFDPRRRLSMFKAYLPINIILNLKLQDPIIVFDRAYRINKIVTNFETGVSTLELINRKTDISSPEENTNDGRTIDRTVLTIDNTKVKIDTTDRTI